jgi:2-methylcitrate dehydratase PrpD
MSQPTPKDSVSQTLAAKALAVRAEAIPPAVVERAEQLLIDVVGLCIAARNTDYMRAMLASVDVGGACTAIGHSATFSAADAALINGTAVHGEDFDDTFEGGPIHSSAVIVPAVLAACERFECDGQAALLGIVTGVEAACRLSMVVPKAVHRSGFHPTSVLGTPAAALAVAVVLGLDRQQTVDALGHSGSLAAGIIEYLAEGAWTKRIHPGWAAQAGLQAARLGEHGFFGPRTVFEGVHGLFNGFARNHEGNYAELTEDFGSRWVMEHITFKPYATGTMNQPYVDCALKLARHGVAAEEVADILCETAEGYVHRLWDPLASKHRPPNEYIAKFSAPFNIAVAYVTGAAGLAAFTEATVRDECILALASKVRYVVNPNDPYPKAYTGHVRMTLKDGRVLEERQPHIRGGSQEPLSRAEIEAKFLGNCEFGGWSKGRAQRFLDAVPKFFRAPLDLSVLRG